MMEGCRLDGDIPPRCTDDLAQCELVDLIRSPIIPDSIILVWSSLDYDGTMCSSVASLDDTSHK